MTGLLDTSTTLREDETDRWNSIRSTLSTARLVLRHSSLRARSETLEEGGSDWTRKERSGGRAEPRSCARTQLDAQPALPLCSELCLRRLPTNWLSLANKWPEELYSWSLPGRVSLPTETAALSTSLTLVYWLSRLPRTPPARRGPELNEHKGELKILIS